MADNTTLPGTGETVRTVDRAGVETQVVLLDVGGAGGEVLAPGDAANGLDVDVTRVQGTVTVSGTVTANAGTGTLAVSDGGATLSVDDGGGALTVDGAVSIAAAIPAGTNNIGDVNVASVPDATTATGTLGALNATVAVSLRGHAGAGVRFVSAGNVLSVYPEMSLDGGTTWWQTHFYSNSGAPTEYEWGPPVGTSVHAIGALPGATHARVRVASYTSGSVTATLTASSVGAPSFPFAQVDGEVHVFDTLAVVGGVGPLGNALSAQVATAAPDAAAPGFVVRQAGELPAGTQNIGDVDVLSLPATTNAGATARTADYDTGAGTVTTAMLGLALPAAGGPAAGGTSTNPVRTDPTGTTTQPVSDAGGSLTVDGSVAVSSLPALAAGTANIGDVDVLTLPALPAGTNNIGDVDVLTLPALAAGDNVAGRFKVTDGTTVASVTTGSSALRTEDTTQPVTVRVGTITAAPAASAVLADSGPMTAGTYLVEFNLAAQDTLAVGKGMVIEHRNAANSATTLRLGGCTAGGSESGTIRRLTLATNERVRVIAGTAAGAASSQYVAHLALYPVS